ncbi:hypothetical protein [Paraburkholderia panacisoli]|jgi:hypothetical protein|uniref:hypothetical protein n=1 Tax=Paraburkholderia panacisoli TaxID=2603818 RepID=UPI00165FCB5A|nr:hypothetical protein [Paraburkholderia panacisoli]
MAALTEPPAHAPRRLGMAVERVIRANKADWDFAAKRVIVRDPQAALVIGKDFPGKYLTVWIPDLIRRGRHVHRGRLAH